MKCKLGMAQACNPSTGYVKTVGSGVQDQTPCMWSYLEKGQGED